MSLKESGIHIHEEWKGMTQPVGIVVEPTVLDRLGIFPEKNIRVVSNLQTRLESLFVEQIRGEEIYSAVINFKDFCKEVLDWQENDLVKPEEVYVNNLNKKIYVELDDYGEVLKPDWVVPEINEENNKKVQIIVKELEIGTPFDQVVKNSDNKKIWEATPHQRLERLLKETENPIGILWNGISLRLVYAPRGESSGHITFPLEPMTSVDGRPMIAALEMLLGPDRLFEGGSKNLRLKKLMEQSRKEQNEVSTRLSEQVLDALWILVRGFDDAESKAKSAGQSIFYDLPENDPSHIYGGLITVLLRLVFLLYSEDEELMPIDPIYSENYSVTGLASRLRRERSEFQSSMEERQGSWSSLLSLFRLVFDGGGPYETYLPARHGELFDPDAYPFLEGRTLNSSYKDKRYNNLNLISDDVVEKVLNKLLILDGQILSYRALDVEEIGSVYEGIMGFNIERVKTISAGILYKPSRQKFNISFIFNVEEFLMQPINKREKWLNDQSGVDLKLSPKIKKNLKDVINLDEICLALENRLSPYTPRGLNPGSLILQPTAERRRSGSHYTPRTLTEPIVEETFRPWLEQNQFNPSPKEILNLKICDPAMGSGAFLVAACRFLASHLVLAWERNGFPSEFDESFDKDIYARRLVAQCCLYGVDKNPFAVNLAKLSLWLITLSRELPFTFVDHALKCGDSLIGYSLTEIHLAQQKLQLGFLNPQNQFLSNLSFKRLERFAVDNRDDVTYDNKKQFLDQQELESEGTRRIADMMVAAFFDSKNAKERKDKQNAYLAMLSNESSDETLHHSIETIRINLKAGDKGIKPFHWDLEFPEVFESERKGFDAFIGNPPFAGKNTIAAGNRNGILDWFKKMHPECHGNADLVAHFFRRCFQLLRKDGSLGLIATKTIAQGDTRSTGLRWICLNQGTIYSATKRYKWPGVAAVIVSIVHIIKGDYSGRKILDHQYVDLITAFLFTGGGHDDPVQLKANKGKSFSGSIVQGRGFTFDDSDDADDETPGTPSPISTMRRLIEQNPKNSELIHPFIGGDEVNKHPNLSHHRYVIDFRDRTEEDCRENWPDLMDIIEKKVRPLRQEKKEDGSYRLRKPLPQRWWIHGEKRPGLYKAIEGLDKVLVTSAAATKYLAFPFLKTGQRFSHKLVVFPFDSYAIFACLISQIHTIFAEFTSGTMGISQSYNPTDSLETFPFPFDISKVKDPSFLNNSHYKKLYELGMEYHNLRADIMDKKKIGLTNLYNLFHNPNTEDTEIINLRSIHEKIDRHVLKLYEWDQIKMKYGYSIENIDSLIIEEDIKLPTEFEQRIEDENFFFENKNQAFLFKSQFNSIIKNKQEIKWRYQWDNQTIKKVIENLFELNTLRSQQENENEMISIKTKKSTSSGKIRLQKAPNEQIQIGLEL